MNRKIEIVVAKSGETTIETKGFEGSSCQSATQFLQTALGKSIGQNLKTEFFQTSVTKQQTHQ